MVRDALAEVSPKIRRLAMPRQTRTTISSQRGVRDRDFDLAIAAMLVPLIAPVILITPGSRFGSLQEITATGCDERD